MRIQTANHEKLLNEFQRLGFRGSANIQGDEVEFIPESPLTEMQEAQLAIAVAAHDPSETLEQKRRDPAFRRAEYALLKPPQEQIDYIARLMGLRD